MAPHPITKTISSTMKIIGETRLSCPREEESSNRLVCGDGDGDRDCDSIGDTDIDCVGDGNGDCGADIDGDGDGGADINCVGDGNGDGGADIDCVGDGDGDGNGDGSADIDCVGDGDRDGNGDVGADIDCVGDGNGDVGADIECFGDGAVCWCVSDNVNCVQFRSPFGSLTTTEIMSRIIRNRLKFEQRNRRKLEANVLQHELELKHNMNQEKQFCA